jgi:Rod binding domain-containing protein
MLSIAATAAATAATGSVSSQATTAVTPQPRLVKAAHEFEAQMMQELLKPMMASNGLDGEDNETASGSGGALGAFASEALGRGLSEHGGFGIASSIVRELTPKGNTSVTAQVTGNVHGNTVMKTHE